MKKYTLDDCKKNTFKNYPEIEELYKKEHLKFLISQEIKNIRNKRKYSQLELARKSGTTQSVIARIEN
ncbi:helix-turn-helix transcriptional regulator [bacterium]|jgi:predicted transcriptional regulator|nr:helix-turn-helix transcriptional regulator [bacterium]